MVTTDMAEPRVLIADDQPDLLEALRLLLEGDGIQMEAVTSPHATLAALGTGTFDLLLMDLNYTCDTTSGSEGMDLLARVRTLDALLPIIVMTGWGSIDLAVESMRLGVRDFLRKPWDNQQLLAKLRAAIEDGRDVRRRRARERREMDEALRIQRQLLPATMPVVEGWEIASYWEPAAGVAGDCYDAIAFSPTRVGLSIADVVGKGIPAALLMSNLQATVRAFATDATSPGALCALVNRILCGHVAEGRFISFFYCVLDTAHATLTYANAGHFPPMLIRTDGTVTRLTAGGPALGILPDGAYLDERVTICPGDRLVLFTDGITEACNDTDDEFGEERLAALAVEHRACSAHVLQSRLAEAVTAFAGRKLHDDATLVVVGSAICSTAVTATECERDQCEIGAA